MKTIYYLLFFTSKVTKIVSISKSVQVSCIKTYNFKESNCLVIHRGIDTEIYSQEKTLKEVDDKDRIKLLYTGNIQSSKGIDDLIDSLQFVNKPIKLTLCGNGNQKYVDSITSKLNSFGLNHELEWAGALSQEDLVYQYNTCDMFVFPSHAEGLGKSLIEAMGCGCPVICSNIDTFEEIVEDHFNGLMVKVKSPESLANAILKYISNPQLREYCGKNARNTIKKQFSKEVEINSWEKILTKRVI